jgi:hypothetical protein
VPNLKRGRERKRKEKQEKFKGRKKHKIFARDEIAMVKKIL